VGLLSRLTTAGLMTLAVTGSYHVLRRWEFGDRFGRPGLRAGSGIPVEHAFFSPAVDLERIELDELLAVSEGPRRSRVLNIAMYAFTDSALARLLIAEADSGVTIRIYRDGEQYEQEEREAVQHGRSSVIAMFRGHANIHIRVKAASRSDLMHLKCWSDGRVLRDGSANWSPAGLRWQDNEIRFTTAPQEVREFNREFERIWNRPTNARVQ
jgi:phosphatidylserine/phosphatidylglycerophosphate/cardiolipin synthase-like enzyme